MTRIPTTTAAVLAALLWLGAAPAAAQDFAVTGATLDDGAAGVPLRDTLRFSLSRQLPFNSLFTAGFRFEPARDVFRRYTFLDADRQTPLFVLEHEPDTDYAAIVYGLRSEDGRAMDRPFTLNYTTAPQHGSRRVSGRAAFGARTTGAADLYTASSHAAPVRAALDAALAAGGRHVGQAAVRSDGAAPEPGVAFRAFQRLANQRAADDLDRTVVLLLDAYTLHERQWIVRAATALDDAGAFRFDHVRDGTYYPLAVNYATGDGDAVGAYGFFDADGDHEPDPVTVADGDVAGIDLTLVAYRPSTMAAARVVADARAGAVATDARLTRIGTTPVSLQSDEVGAAYAWQFEYHSAAASERIFVFVDPVAARADVLPGGDPSSPAVPADALDSDAALARADALGGAAFRAEHGEDRVQAFVYGGHQPGLRTHDPDRLVWVVDYVAEGVSEALTFVLDMRTGEQLDGRPTSVRDDDGLPAAASLAPAYPNPFNPQTTLAYTLARPVPVRLAVYDVLGREVDVLVDGQTQPAGTHTAAWNAAGRPSGLYFVRLEAGGRVLTQRATLLK